MKTILHLFSSFLVTNKKQPKTFITALLLLTMTINLSAQTTTNVSYTNPIFESGYDAKASFKDGYYYYVKWSQGKVPGVDNYIYKTKILSELGTPKALPNGAPLSPPIYISTLYGKTVNKWYLFGQGLWECDGDPYTGTWTNKVGDLYKQMQYRLDFYPFFYKGELFVAWAGNENTTTYDWGFESVFISKVNYDGTTFSLAQPVASGGNMVATYSFGYGQRPQFGSSGVVVEAPAVYTPSMFGISGRDDEMFMLLSINGANTNMYAVGMIYFTGTSATQVSSPDYWKKVDYNGEERLFASNNADQSATSLHAKGIKGPGVAALAPSPDNSKLYMYYHSKHNDGFNNGNTAYEWERRIMLQEIGWRTFNGKMIPDFTAKPIVGLNETGTVQKAVTNYWNFTSDLEGWTLNSQMAGSVSSNMIKTTISGNDPYMHSPDQLGISGSEYKYVVVRMRNMTTATTGELFWTTSIDGAWNGSKHVTFPITANATKQMYHIIDLSANANWKGIIKQIRLDPTTTATSGTVNIDFIKFVGTYAAAIAIPGVLESENFNKGGQGNAYYDVDPYNYGEKYRTSESVDIESTSDVGGGYNIGWTAVDEWMEYLVDVKSSNDYNITVRVASASTGKGLRLEIDGEKIGTSYVVPNTGGWQTYTNQTMIAWLNSGKHILRVYNETNEFNINKITFTANPTTGIQQLEKTTTLSIMPNPAQNQVQLSFSTVSENNQLLVFDMLGNVVYSEIFSGKNDFKTTINTENWSEGLYLVSTGDSVSKLLIAK
ncbi:MAG: carbohydrate-binding protein [Bacteroidetes bacterium]|nr:carbohydrate-binding protein [Bacteroidota bacterium]